MSALQFMGNWPFGTTTALAGLLAALAFWLYRRQLRSADLGAVGWFLPSLRGGAIAIVTLTLAEPVIESRQGDGDLARLTFLLDASRSMSITTSELASQLGSADQTTQFNRFERATRMLTGQGGFLSAFGNDFDVNVARFDRQAAVELWNPRTGLDPNDQDLAFNWGPATWGEATAIGDALDPFATANNTLVLLSDGQSNQGNDPSDAAQRLAEQGATLFTIGLGPYQATSDLALQQLAIPDRLYRTDTLSGTATIAQHLARGKRFTLQLEHNAEVVWQEAFIATDERQREIAFAFPIAPLFDDATAQLPAGTQVASLPLKLTGRIVTEYQLDAPASGSSLLSELPLPQRPNQTTQSLALGADTVAESDAAQWNNSRDAYTQVVSHKSRLLIIDGRSRWETRYLKNMFTRDPSWQVDALILTPDFDVQQNSSSDATQAQLSSDFKRLPATKEKLFEFDLVILGEVDALAFPTKFLDWLREYVELTGGGLIIVDGAREALRVPQYEILQRLSPVKWLEVGQSPLSSTRASLPKVPRPTPVGQSVEALQLSPEGAEASAAVWSELPPLQFVSRVAPLPGAEVLLEAVTAVDRFPLLITRRYGGGRVLFSASDETWRWRYELAEHVHSRLWLQLARWTMKMPLSLRGEFVSLDTGGASYLPGQSIPVRCQLRQPDGMPASQLSPSLIVMSGIRTVTTLPLVEESVGGTYSTAIVGLPAGDYQVRVAAPSFSTQALALQSQFSVLAPPSREMQQLACDEESLAAIASRTGGKYLRESQASELVELLQPRVRGKIRTSTLLLWQSYWWFAAAMLLLIIEWIVRKRVGLV